MRRGRRVRGARGQPAWRGRASGRSLRLRPLFRTWVSRPPTRARRSGSVAAVAGEILRPRAVSNLAAAAAQAGGAVTGCGSAAELVDEVLDTELDEDLVADDLVR